MPDTKSSRITITLSIIFVGYILYILSIALFSEYKIKTAKTDRTVGTITHVNYGAKVNPWYTFLYNVNGIEYTTIWRMNIKFVNMTHNEHQNYIGSIFYVIYVVDDPKIGRLQINEPYIE